MTPKLHTINTGYFKLDGGAMFGVVPKSIWQKTNPADEHNLCDWALRSLLIEDDDRLILVDTGTGNKQDDKFFRHYYLHGDDTLQTSLRHAGFELADITDVILTHLHFDHCGGAITREKDSLIPYFPNATYWSNKRHWDWATDPNPREKASFLKENILPVRDSGKLKFIAESPLTSFSSHVSLRFAYGHTDAMMLPQVDLNGRTLVFMADLLPSTGHIPLPYVMSYDMFPLKTMAEKTAFFNEAVDNDFTLFLQHDPVNECCKLMNTEKGIRLQNTFTLKEWLQGTF